MKKLQSPFSILKLLFLIVVFFILTFLPLREPQCITLTKFNFNTSTKPNNISYLSNTEVKKKPVSRETHVKANPPVQRQGSPNPRYDRARKYCSQYNRKEMSHECFKVVYNMKNDIEKFEEVARPLAVLYDKRAKCGFGSGTLSTDKTSMDQSIKCRKEFTDQKAILYKRAGIFL